MLRMAILAGLSILAAAPWGHSGPVHGQVGRFYKIPGAPGSEPIPLELTETFRGGQRACVFVRGDHDPIVPMDVTVYDKEGAMVAKDESTRDFIAVFWVPQRTAEFRIVVRNHGREYNKAYVVLK